MYLPAPDDASGAEADERVMEGIVARMRASIAEEYEQQRQAELAELASIKEKLLRKLGVAESAEPARSMLEKPKRAIDLGMEP